MLSCSLFDVNINVLFTEVQTAGDFNFNTYDYEILSSVAKEAEVPIQFSEHSGKKFFPGMLNTLYPNFPHISLPICLFMKKLKVETQL